MDRELRSRKRWDTASLALHGALLGMTLAMLEQFCHAFCPASGSHTPGSPAGDLLVHVLLEVVIAAAAGATLFAAISLIRNRLMRDE
jgi:hypothetical protein